MSDDADALQEYVRAQEAYEREQEREAMERARSPEVIAARDKARRDMLARKAQKEAPPSAELEVSRWNERIRTSSDSWLEYRGYSLVEMERIPVGEYLLDGEDNIAIVTPSDVELLTKTQLAGFEIVHPCVEDNGSLSDENVISCVRLVNMQKFLSFPCYVPEEDILRVLHERDDVQLFHLVQAYDKKEFVAFTSERRTLGMSEQHCQGLQRGYLYRLQRVASSRDKDSVTVDELRAAQKADCKSSGRTTRYGGGNIPLEGACADPDASCCELNADMEELVKNLMLVIRHSETDFFDSTKLHTRIRELAAVETLPDAVSVDMRRLGDQLSLYEPFIADLYLADVQRAWTLSIANAQANARELGRALRCLHGAVNYVANDDVYVPDLCRHLFSGWEPGATPAGAKLRFTLEYREPEQTTVVRDAFANVHESTFETTYLYFTKQNHEMTFHEEDNDEDLSTCIRHVVMHGSRGAKETFLVNYMIEPDMLLRCVENAIGTMTGVSRRHVTEDRADVVTIIQSGAEVLHLLSTQQYLALFTQGLQASSPSASIS